MVGERDTQGMLDRDACLSLLRSVDIGRVAWATDDGDVTVVPVNFALAGEDIVFSTATGGKLDAVRSGRSISFEADDLEPALRSGWSVLVVGHAELAAETDPAAGQRSMPWDRRPKPYVIRLHLERVSGYRLPLHGGGVSIEQGFL
ncbi:pyridoxamine 5'-phosphate oxidase family protein [Actinoallomurus oryzae]|jgi:nitroimidazol reductase NimA-like FMN-containing flavoprotein (pyridoxamine 5'-phosphate oxidase superfamily)|uniref:Pyridoxamine 5'-phosphate oxidase family protein n=1 Tax=Actinoallomurus oryzae TaxID=502180 RepID=A0ABP8PV72_9ACTN